MSKQKNSWGADWKSQCLPLILALVLAVAGCGGGGSAAPAPDNSGLGPGGNGNPAAVLKPFEGQGRPLGAPLPNLTVLASQHGASSATSEWPGGQWPDGLGAVPASGGYSVDASGPQLVDMSGGSFVDGNLHLESDSNDQAWAVFRVSGLGAMDIGGIGIDGDPSVGGQRYLMAAGDFADDEWDFSEEGEGSDFDWDFADESGDYTDEEGDGYFAIVVPEGGSCCCADCVNIYPDEEGDDSSGGYDEEYDEPCSGDGEISSISENLITLDGVDSRSWELTADTEYYDADGEDATAADFGAGDYVFIAGEPCEDSEAASEECCEAMAVFAYDAEDWEDSGTDDYAEGDYYYGEGVVDEIGGGRLVVDGEELVYDAQTVWYGLNDEEGSEADFHAGDYIGLLVEESGEAYYLVEAYNYGSDEGDDYSDGGDDSYDDGGDYTDDGGDYTDDGGDYTDDGGDYTDDGGDYTDDGGSNTDDGSDNAGGGENYIEFSETVVSVGAGMLVTGSHSMSYDEYTVFVDAEGNEIRAEDIQAGDSIYVEAFDDGEGLIADYVEIESTQ